MTDYHSTKVVPNRNIGIDYMRAIGTLLIILAHVNPPKIILNLRTFDVTMLVFVSGMSLNLTKNASFKSIVYKRIKQLILPIYILTAFLLLSSTVIFYIKNGFFYINIGEVITAFILFEGVPYIWIGKIYFAIGILSPILFYSGNKKKDDLSQILIIIASILLMVISISQLPERVLSNSVFNAYILQVLPYVIVAYIGLVSYRSDVLLKLVSYLSVLCFLVSAIFVSRKVGLGNMYPNDFKYPPQLYYLSFGVMISILIYKYFSKYLNVPQWVVFFSENSFKLYIAHIISLYIFKGFRLVLPLSLLQSWLINYIVVVFISVIIVYFYNNLFLTKVKKTN